MAPRDQKMPMSDVAVGQQHQQQHLRAARCRREEEKEGGGREGEADDVKRFKSFRSPLHDM